MAALKTQKTDASVDGFIDALTDPAVQADCRALLKRMRSATNAEPKMWGSSIVGFGNYSYSGSSGKVNEWFQVGFSPRKGTLTLYAMGGWDDPLLTKLGKHTTGNSCLYIKRLSDVDDKVLTALIGTSVKRAKTATQTVALKRETKPNSPAAKTKPAKAKIALKRVTVRNPLSPDHISTVEADKYDAMKRAMLKALPRKAPGLTQAELFEALLPHLPDELFPGGAKAGWWSKCVQLDLEFHGSVIREVTKPLRWHKK